MADVRRLTSEKERALVEYLTTDPVIAANKILMRGGESLELAPHQRITLRESWERRPFNLWIWGRGVAKTFMMGLYGTLAGTFIPGQRIGIISASYRQSQFVFDEVRRFYDDSPYIQGSVVKPPAFSPSECSMTWANKSFIKAIPIGDGKKIRGYRFNILFIDELAQVDPEVIDLVIRPMLNVKSNPMSKNKNSLGNQVIMASSAYYQFNHLYDKYCQYKEKIVEGDKRYSLMEFTYHDLPDGWMDMDQLEESKRTVPRLQFLMENENLFPADSEGFFPASLLYSVQSKNALLESKGRDGYQYVMGIDPAREADNMAIIIIRLGDDFNKVVRVHTMHRRTFPEMVGQIRRFLNEYNIVRIALDQGGGGGTIRDLLAEEHITFDSDGVPKEHPPILPIDPQEFPNRTGRRILDIVYFSSKVVNEMNHSLKAELENKQILLPAAPQDGNAQRESLYREVEQMVEECKTIVTAPLKNGMLNFDVPNQRMKKDRYSGFLLAAKAARDYTQEIKTPEVEKLPTGFWLEGGKLFG